MTPVRVTHRDTGFWFKDFPSIAAAAKELELPIGSISRVISGEYEYSGAYIFTLVPKEEPNEN